MTEIYIAYHNAWSLLSPINRIKITHCSPGCLKMWEAMRQLMDAFLFAIMDAFLFAILNSTKWPVLSALLTYAIRNIKNKIYCTFALIKTLKQI